MIRCCHSLPFIGWMSASVAADDVSDTGSRHQPVSLGAVKMLQLEVKQSWCHLHVGANSGHHNMYNLLWSKMLIAHQTVSQCSAPLGY